MSDDLSRWAGPIAPPSAADSERTDLTLGVQYRDTCRRFPRGWLITHRKVVIQWAEGQFPKR